MEQAAFDPIGIAKLLIRHKVQFVIIGGFAANVRGSPVATFDLDVCYSRAPENLERLAAALKEIHASLRGAPPGLPFILDMRTLQNGDHFTFSTDLGPFDCLGTPAGVKGYDSVAANADVFDLDGVVVQIASIEDLMLMKRAANRPKDRYALEHLGALRDRIDEQASRHRDEPE